MTTYRKYRTYWTEVKSVIDGKVVPTVCCCKDPGGTRRTCMLWGGRKTPCRCHCHTLRIREERQ